MGTPVEYRITVTNQGTLPLTGISLVDTLTDLADCVVPDTLQPLEAFSCVYPGLATLQPIVNTATADSDQTGARTSTAIVNGLVVPPSLEVVKSVATSAAGPWVDQLTAPLGSTVIYRIEVTNNGGVDLTGITLVDDLTDLTGLDPATCAIPTTLAVGVTFECRYPDTVALGTTVNTATADSTETSPDQDSATVRTPTFDLAVDKGVSLDPEGPFVDQLLVGPGTTVHYRIRVTNTGTDPLTGVTLTDDRVDLSTLDPAACAIPDTLPQGATAECVYSAAASVGTTVNTATADSIETEPVADIATVVAGDGPPYDLGVEMGVRPAGAGPFLPRITVLVSSPIEYRIRIRNLGTEPLTALSLVDTLGDVAAEGCVVRPTLAAGAVVTCIVPATAAAIPTTDTDTAIGDSAETEARQASATVDTVEAALSISKGVSKSPGGPFVGVLQVATRQTVHYRIVVTNTGGLPLTGLVVADDRVDLEAAGCELPASLAVGASATCDYPAFAAKEQVVNTATADSVETGPVSASATVQGGGVLDETVGRLELAKVISDAKDFAGATFTFDVDCTGTSFDASYGLTVGAGDDRASMLIEESFPSGTECTVEERLPRPTAGKDWYWVGIDYEPAATVTIPEADVITVTVTNERVSCLQQPDPKLCTDTDLAGVAPLVGGDDRWLALVILSMVGSLAMLDRQRRRRRHRSAWTPERQG